MDFSPAPEQEEIDLAAAALAGRAWPVHEVAALASRLHDGTATSPDPQGRGWDLLVAQGWLDPGLDMVTLGLLAVRAGEYLLPLPWLDTAAAAPALHGPAVNDGTNDATNHATGHADPVRPVALAEPGLCDLVAQEDLGSPGGWRLKGSAALVPGAATAGRVLLPARIGSELGVFLLPLAASGHEADAGDHVRVRPAEVMDPFRPRAGLRLTDAPAQLVAGPGEAAALLCTLRLRRTTLLACEAVGAGLRALEMATGHARDREQFGRPIGIHQAVSHPLAGVYAELALARSLALRASWHVDHEGDPSAVSARAETAVAAAAVACPQAAVLACEAAQQTLGAMGMTWEHPLHWWYRRALGTAALLGRDEHLDLIAARLFDE